MARSTSATKATSTASNAGRRSRATYTHVSRDKYVGAWKDGKMHGKGTYTHADGAKYVGKYKDDVPHGFGTQFSADGTITYQGEWVNGKPVHGPYLGART